MGGRDDARAMMLMMKQSEVLWTIASHFESNAPSLHAKCEEIKALQSDMHKSLKDAVQADGAKTLDIPGITSVLEKHEFKLNELGKLLEVPEEQVTITNEAKNA